VPTTHIRGIQFTGSLFLFYGVTIQLVPPAALPGANLLKRLPNRSFFKKNLRQM